MRIAATLVVLWQIQSRLASFGEPFFNYLVTNHGLSAALVLDRPDFGNEGSFGGTSQGNGLVTRRLNTFQPVIIVHGVTNTAYKFNFVRQFLLKNNYTDDEIYGTTWGEGANRFILWVRLECQYIKQVRVLISSVAAYTNSKVDVIAFSMGSPVSRKAILGGKCGDEDIGPSITNLVETFVGVAGANYGSFMCVVPFAICNKKNGLHCHSEMLENINSQPGKYEASRVYAIYSSADDKVGLDCCGTNCSSVPNADGEFVFEGWNHDQIMTETLSLQLDLIKRS
ncbi:hypothetical protein PFISCL1PPCAC_26253, partial [Pristionchus fissidentatus]